jgi:signal peptidase I
MGRHRAPRRRRPLVNFAVIVLVTLAVAAVLRSFVLQSYWIPSESMEPTLHGCTGCHDDRILVARLAYRLHPVHRNDIVVFHRPPQVAQRDRYLVKRVIGLPGDTVGAHDGLVWINGRPQREAFVNSACAGTAAFASVVVPYGRLFVLGDNRCHSFDSRGFGPISESSVIGRAFARVWPLSRWREL